MSDGSDEFGQHEHQKGQEVKTSQTFRGSFEVTSQTSEACCPGEAALDDPSSWQKDKTFLGFRQFDNDQFDARFLRYFLWVITGVALIHIGDFNRVAGNL